MTTMTLACTSCDTVFDFTSEEQAFYEEKGFTPPKRCKPCRDAAKQQRRNSDGGGYGGGYNNYERRERVMHDAVCAQCGCNTQVPFKPNGEKPVYCRECFSQSSY